MALDFDNLDALFGMAKGSTAPRAVGSTAAVQPDPHPTRTRILVAETYALFRYGIISILAQEPDFEVVGEATDSRTAIDRAAETSPDVVLVDLSIRPTGGLETSRRIKRGLPDARMVLLGGAADPEALMQAIKAGVTAVVPRDVDPNGLAAIVRGVAMGEDPLVDAILEHPTVARRVIKELCQQALSGRPAATIKSPLSPRQLEILDNIARGMSNREVADAMSISVQTVKNQMSTVMRKLSIKGRTRAVVYAANKGWIRARI